MDTSAVKSKSERGLVSESRHERTFPFPLLDFTALVLTLKPGLHIVVRVAEHACDDASKRIFRPSTHRLQIFLVRDQYLRSLLPLGDQTIAGQLEKHVLKPMLAILTTHMETRLNCILSFGRRLEQVYDYIETRLKGSCSKVCKLLRYLVYLFLVI